MRWRFVVTNRGLEQQRGSILEVHKILKKGGQFLILHLPNRFTWIEFLVRLISRTTGSFKHAHTRLFSYADVVELLQGTSFEILESGRGWPGIDARYRVAQRHNFIPRNSFNRRPKSIADSPRVCRWIDALDDDLVRLFAPVTQNWYFVLRKRN
jgi:hypothetical protein